MSNHTYTKKDWWRLHWFVFSLPSRAGNRYDSAIHFALAQLLGTQQLFVIVILACRKHRNRDSISYAYERLDRHNIMTLNLYKMLFESDRLSVDNCRLDMKAFAMLCHLLKIEWSLKENGNMSVEEMVINKW